MEPDQCEILCCWFADLSWSYLGTLHTSGQIPYLAKLYLSSWISYASIIPWFDSTERSSEHYLHRIEIICSTLNLTALTSYISRKKRYTLKCNNNNLSSKFVYIFFFHIEFIAKICTYKIILWNFWFPLVLTSFDQSKYGGPIYPHYP